MQNDLTIYYTVDPEAFDQSLELQGVDVSGSFENFKDECKLHISNTMQSPQEQIHIKIGREEFLQVLDENLANVGKPVLTTVNAIIKDIWEYGDFWSEYIDEEEEDDA